MKRLRDRLIVLFLIATVAPLAATIWLTTSLLERSLRYATTRELDQLSRALEDTGREYYQLSRESLRRDALSGAVPPERYVIGARGQWPEEVRQFWESGQAERFYLSGAEGDRLNYLARRSGAVLAWSRPMGAVAMEQLRRQYMDARKLVEAGSGRDLRRGFILTFLVLALGAWLVALALLMFFAARVSGPIDDLTGGLSRLASGDLMARVGTDRDDEVGQAILAFNHMAEQLEHQRARLIYLTQLASWQALARKMAHELKNSLTPIRLTMEEMQARAGDGDRLFPAQAAEIVIDEVDSLERRVRAFSEFAAEPPVRAQSLDLNSQVEERASFLGSAHPEVVYDLRLAPELPPAFADADLVKGILTNLLENAAEAAGAGGKVLVSTAQTDGKLAVEVHDSGPGLSEMAHKSLFEPTISFKKHGMGLGLSIARKSALLSGGDIFLVRGELGGAAFRVLLPQDAAEPDPDR
jgi:two-component system, NtrC family, nitrogen regulation sensor histidine kinase NtrY